MKRAPTHCPTQGKLDNNLSPRVGDFAQKNHPRPKLPGGGPSGIHLILPLCMQHQAKLMFSISGLPILVTGLGFGIWRENYGNKRR